MIGLYAVQQGKFLFLTVIYNGKEDDILLSLVIPKKVYPFVASQEISL